MSELGADLGPRQRLVVLATCCLSLFLVTMDLTIVNVALPSIRRDLHASVAGLQWSVDGYTVVVASFLMVSGSMADRFGRRRVFQIGLAVFSLGSLLCSLAPTTNALVGFRMLQALGGSMLNPIAMSIIVNTFADPRERARAIGVWGAVFGVSMAAGPLLGGALVDSIGWRSIFWVNVPVGVLAIALTARFVPESRADRPRRFDLVAQVLIIVGLLALTSAVIDWRRSGWLSLPTAAGFGAALACVVALVIWESRRAEPLLDLRFFRSLPFTLATVIAVLSFAAFSGFLFLNTLYLQEARGLHASAAGLMTLPVALGLVVCSPLAGRLVGAGYVRLAIVVAGAAISCGALILTRLANDTPLPWRASAPRRSARNADDAERYDDARQTRAPAPAESLAKGGWKVVRETSYLRDLALLVLAAAVIEALLDWLLSAHASRTYGKGPELLAFFALFNMVVGVLSFAAQTGLSRPLLEWRGLAGTIKSQPLTVGVFAVFALASPHLWPVMLLRGAEGVARNSVYRSAYELFYTPLATAKKRATKTIIDVGADRIGTAVGSVALLAVVHLDAELATRAVLVGALAMAGLAWIVASRLHGGYVSALASSLKSGAIALEYDDIRDLTTKNTFAETAAHLDRAKLLEQIELFQKEKDLANDPAAMSAGALRSGDVDRIKASLSAPLTPALASIAIPLLANDAVVRDVLRALRKVAPTVTEQLVDALRDPNVDSRARRRIPRILKECRTQGAATGLLMALKDPVFEIRVQAALALARIRNAPHIELSREEIFDVGVHELTHGRASWRLTTTTEALLPEATEDDLHRGLAHTFSVLGLVLEREPLSIAYRAMRGEDPVLHGTAYEYLEVVLPSRLRDLVLPLLSDEQPAAKTQERGRKELADELLRSSASVSRR